MTMGSTEPERMCGERPGQADCNLGSSSLDGARERGPSLFPSEMGAPPHPRWPVLAGRQSHDPSSQQAVSRGFDVLVADAVKLWWQSRNLRAARLPLARPPFTGHMGTPPSSALTGSRQADPLPSLSLQTTDRGQPFGAVRLWE